MTTNKQTQKMIRSEIGLLNAIIDQKIVYGRSYRRESLRHRQLLAQLTRLERAQLAGSQWGWLSRSMRTVTSFVL